MKIVDKEDCVMCLTEIRNSHLPTFYALGLRKIDINVCVDHEINVQVAIKQVDKLYPCKSMNDMIHTRG